FLATGGKNLKELAVLSRIATFVRELIRAGRAHIVDSSELGKWEKHAASLPLRSNDAHIIGLAMVSGARVLYSRDNALMQDFKDRRFITKPRGKCYSHAVNHSGLLK